MYLLDHIVHFVKKPEKLIDATKELGLRTVNGGKHEIWGTYNSLCYFGLTYIEFIGIFDGTLFEKSAQKPFTLHETYKNGNYQNGVVRIALRTETIENDAEKLRSFGFDVFGPEEFSRTRPDGSVLKWQLLHFGKKEQDLDYPFIIQWEGNDDERYKELVELGAITPHPLGNLQIKEIVFEVEDLSSITEWGRIFGFEMEMTNSCTKLEVLNCLFTFKKSSSRSNGIIQLTLSGSSEEKEVRIEGTKYHFVNELQ